MKKIMLFLLLVVMLPVRAQDVNAAIARQFQQYSQLVIDKDIEAALDYTNEDLFTIIPREQLKAVMESVFNMPSLEYKAELPKILAFEPLKTIDGAHYVRFKHEARLQMKFLDEAGQPAKTAAELKEHQALLLSTFQGKYGQDNVTFDEASGFYNIRTVKWAVAKSKDRKDWKFAVVDNARMKALLEKFIPKEMLD